ncbi:MAG: prepilin-type N-terminal cleavage/methylation domain-containing protein [Desulfobacteraceae bacterium]|nr:prepilin-type N-terminal cleavage/methylation domain-containing protein [Desulfobacteraceae bacterium]
MKIIDDPRGFTLIETLVAFMILSISLVIVLELFSGSLKSITISNDYEHGIFHAQEKMEEILALKKLDSINDQGDFSDGYEWSVEVSPEKDILNLNAASKLTIFNIVVKVQWQQFGRTKKYMLKTQKIAQRMMLGA